MGDSKIKYQEQHFENVIFIILRTEQSGALIYNGHLFRADLKQTPKSVKILKQP